MFIKIGWVMLGLAVVGILYGWDKWGELREKRDEEEKQQKNKKKN